MATSTYLTRTGTSGNQKTFTFAGWFKIKPEVQNFCWTAGIYSSTIMSQCYFESDGTFVINHFNATPTQLYNLVTDRLFRDPAAWYHVVVAMDTTQAVAADRTKIYINGVQETSFSTETYPVEDYDTAFNSTLTQSIGRRDGSSTYYDGVMAHLHAADGLAYAPTVFGETDATSGIWIAKSGPSVTYGTNGGFYKFAAGALGTDSSGEGNNMTVTGTMTTTKDTPDNNFMTWNSLAEAGFGNPGGGTFTNGNTTVTLTSANYNPSLTTFGLSAGLWYFEIQQTGISGTQEGLIGIAGDLPIPYDRSSNRPIGYTAMEYSYNMNNGNYYNNNTSTSYGVSSAQDDIIGVYIDLDANKLYFAKNGTIMNSGTGITITAAADNYSEMYIVGATWNSTGAAVYETNFGNGYFGTTVVTSGVADAGGEGTFEYDPSDGGASSFDGSAKNFRAICTNNIATYGG